MIQEPIEEGFEPIAVVGMACRFPDASNVDEFHMNLQQGKESVTMYTKAEMLAAGALSDAFDDPKYVNYGCVLDHIDMFDHDFFGYSLEQAELIDPQQRLFLECAL